MKFKKVLAAAMISLLATTAMVGCGSDKKAADSGKKVQIEYWHVAAESFGGATVKELVADFNKTHPNIEVVEKYNPDMYKGLTQNLQAAMASGKNPDVVQMGYSYLNYAAENFKYTDLNEAFKTAGDANFMQDNYLPNVLQLAQTEDGKQIGLPYSVSVPVLHFARRCGDSRYLINSTAAFCFSASLDNTMRKLPPAGILVGLLPNAGNGAAITLNLAPFSKLARLPMVVQTMPSLPLR